ncbi:MAG: glycosyltransferase involved in cell wall biosynthesis [Paraglaciecola sp.]|jgi:glycosyltransferase involved in cell wall biosynthesis
MNKLSLPIVTVVIPMFNVEKYIEKCIASVLAQTFKNFEVICVDDGCTDNTLAILKQYTDSRIRVISQKNRGLAGARNTGIQAAKGIYIALLDSDDCWADEKLAKHVLHLNSNSDVGVSYCPSVFIDENGNMMGMGQYPKLTGISFRDILCRNPIGNGSAPVIRKRLLVEISTTHQAQDRKYYFDETLRQSEDIELWVRMALLNKWKFEGIPEPLTYYRINDSGLSANLKNQFASWTIAMSKNEQTNIPLFKRLLPLARAYQLRYLARRAIRSGDSYQAIKFIHRALFEQPQILFEEPKRTIVTYVCALLSLLPRSLYISLETLAMRCLPQRQIPVNLKEI